MNMFMKRIAGGAVVALNALVAAALLLGLVLGPLGLFIALGTWPLVLLPAGLAAFLWDSRPESPRGE